MMLINKLFSGLILVQCSSAISLGENQILAALSPKDPHSFRTSQVSDAAPLEDKIAYWDSIVERYTTTKIPSLYAKGVTFHGDNLPVLVRILNTDHVTTDQPYTLKFTMSWQSCRAKSSNAKLLEASSEAEQEDYTPYPPVEAYGFSHDPQYSRFDSGDLNLRFSARLVQLVEPNFTVKTIAELGTYPASEIYPSNADSCTPGVAIPSSKIYSLTFRLDQHELPKTYGPVYFIVNGTTIAPTRSNLKGFQGFTNIGITSH